MAISFARVSVHTRSKGHSAVAAAAYRAGLRLYDERLGQTFDYSKRRDVQYSAILLPEGAHAQFSERSFLWNAVEKAEKRKNSQLCKDILLALPKELDLVQHIELAKRFAQVHFVDKGIPADIAIHNHGDGNPHAHILVTTRRLEKSHFSKYKARDLNPPFAKGFIKENDAWHEEWRSFQQSYFEEKNINLSVDLDHVIPERHHGGFRNPANHYLLEENELIKAAREELALKDLDNFINVLSIEHSVFTREDIETLLFKTINREDYNEFFHVTAEKVLSNRNVICLGENEQGKKAFTTRHQYLQESELLKAVEALQTRQGHREQVDTATFLQETTLTEEQKQAFEFIVHGGDIRCIIGRPGVGKSYMLTPVKEFYQQQGCRVLGASLAGKVAKQLQAESGIESSTIASLTARILSGKLELNANDILIIDEAGMVDFANMSFIIEKVKEAHAKLILVGDPNQLKPIKKGAIFKGIADLAGCFTMVDIKRQRHEGDRQASIDLAKGHVKEGLNHYFSEGAISIADNTKMVFAVDLLIDSWRMAIERPDDLKDCIILAHANSTVDTLNLSARKVLLSKGILDAQQVNCIREVKNKDKNNYRCGDYIVVTHSDNELGLIGGEQGRIVAVDSEYNLTLKMNDNREIQIPGHLRRYVEHTGLDAFCLAKGERIFFKKGDTDIGVKNGDLATVLHVNDDGGFTAQLDSGAVVEVPPRYKQIDYAYAMTVHKSQGMSVDRVYACVDTLWWDRALSFVGFTRHKDKLSIFANSKNHPDFDSLVEQLSRKTLQDNVIDYPLNLGLRHGFDFEGLIARASKRISVVSQVIRDKANYCYHYAQAAQAIREQHEGQVINKKAIHHVAKTIAHYLDLKARIASQYTLLKATSNKIGFALQELSGFDELYQLTRARDQKAAELMHTPGLSLEKIPIRHLNKAQLVTELKRHEKIKTIQAIIKSLDEPFLCPELAQAAYSISLSKDAIPIGQVFKKAPDSEKPFKKRLQTLQQAHQQKVVEGLTSEFPVLKQYNQLTQQRKIFSGFAAEKIDKELAQVAKTILKNPALTKKLQNDLPNLIQRIQSQAQSLGKDRGHER